MQRLDVKKIYELYDGGKLDALAGAIMEHYHGSSGYIDTLAKSWSQNVHFYEGDQHIYYNDTVKQYQVIPTTKYNEHIPRPVTNYIFPIVNTMTAFLTKNRPQANARENSTEDEDINRAKLADVITDAKWEIDDETMLHVQAAKLSMFVSTVFRKDYWDTSGPQTVEIPDENGKVNVLPLGDNKVAILSPYEVFPDPYATNGIDCGEYIYEARFQSVSWIKENFDKKGAGYTGLAESVEPNKKISAVLGYAERLRGSSGKTGQNGAAPEFKDGAVTIELYLKPDKKHKKGVTVIIADDKVLYAGDTKYTYGNGVNWHPYSEFSYAKHPFRTLGIPLVENLVPIQRRINAIDSLIILTRMMMASPQWLIPKGCKIPDGYINGAPGLQIEYSRGMKGEKPERISGVSLDGSVYQEREKAVEEIQRIAATNEVMSGLRPEGVTTASGLNILLEQSYTQHSPLIQAWEKFIEKGQTKKLNIIRRFYKEPRKSLVQRIRSLNKDALEVQIDDTFTGEALGDNVDIRVEAGSSLPRSKIVEQSQLQEIAGAGYLGDITPQGNPIGNKEFLRKFGITDFPTPLNVEVARAKWENSMLRLKRFENAVVLPIDNHELHLKVLTDEMKKPEFYMRNDEEVIEAYVKHQQEHEAEIQTQAMKNPPASPEAQEAQPQEVGGQPPLPPPGGEAGQAMM